MINLLPPRQKKELKEEEKFKLILTFGILLFSFLTSLSLILFLVNITILAELDVQRVYFEEEKSELERVKEFEEKIENINLTFSKLNSFYQNQPNLTEVLEKISEILPSETYLTNFNYNILSEKGEKIRQVSLSGFCESREVLLLFKESLESEEKFSEVYFPPENWIKPSDIDFNLTFKLK